MAKHPPETGFTLIVVSSSNTRTIAAPTAEQLRRHFARCPDALFLNRDDGESGAVWVHLSDDRGWVTHFDHFGGVDSYCRDATYCGPDVRIEFTLSNGQVDEIHCGWTVTHEEALRAMTYFLRHGERDPTLDWVSQPESLREPHEELPAHLRNKSAEEQSG